MIFLIILVCLLATLTGSICGMGGGIIIKPVLDALGVANTSVISFLSACTVLAMSAYSVAEINITKKSEINKKIGTTLALGAAIGGILGKELFLTLKKSFEDASTLLRIQAMCMLLLTLACLIYSFVKGKCKSATITNLFAVAIIGLLLGIMSAFLGIGGGPINVTVLYLLFSMKTKEAAQNSLYIILFCQLFALIWTIIRREVPDFSPMLLVYMAVSGIVGSMSGRYINKKISSGTVDILFRFLMCLIIGINLFNILQ